MAELWDRVVENFFLRLDGPLHFRFIVQPLMAILFAVVNGLKDARDDKPAYFWSIATNPGHRKELLQEGWKHVGKIFILAVLLDLIYQIVVYQRFYPGETLIVAFLLAIIPYLVMRGPVNRVARLFMR